MIECLCVSVSQRGLRVKLFMRRNMSTAKGANVLKDCRYKFQFPENTTSAKRPVRLVVISALGVCVCVSVCVCMCEYVCVSVCILCHRVGP